VQELRRIVPRLRKGSFHFARVAVTVVASIAFTAAASAAVAPPSVPTVAPAPAPGAPPATRKAAPAPAAAAAVVPALYDNCTNFNKRYRHGVGRLGAHDRTKSRLSEPVTNFLRSTLIYNRAMRYNDDLDRDKDGVACEKH
jgi:hypothetical protein